MSWNDLTNRLVPVWLLTQISVLPPRQRNCSDWPGQFQLDGNQNFNPDQIFSGFGGGPGFSSSSSLTENTSWKQAARCYLLSVYQTKKDIKEGNRKRREGGRELWLYSEGIRNSDRVLRDERESADKKDNRGESKVSAPVRLRGGRKKLLFLLPHSIRN